MNESEMRELSRLIAEGLSTENMMRRLHVCESTVYRRTRRLKEELGASTRYQIIKRARQLGWLR
jgi:DNA-binding NarL/FixJ family response regulator